MKTTKILFRVTLPAVVLLSLAYNPATTQIELIKGHKLPRPMYNAAVATDGELIYAVGGEIHDKSENGGFLQEAYWMDPVTGDFDRLSDLDYPVGGAQAAVLDGYLYVTGGNIPWIAPWMNEIGGPSSDAILETWGIESYVDIFGYEVVATARRLDLGDPDAEWEAIDHMNAPRTNHSLDVVDGRLVATAGNYYSNPFPLPFPQDCTFDCEGDFATPFKCNIGRTETYDPDQDEWIDTEALSISRNIPGTAVVGDDLVVAGGRSYTHACGDSGEPTSRVEILRAGAEGFEYTADPPQELITASGTALGQAAWFLVDPIEDGGATIYGYSVPDDTWSWAELEVAVRQADILAVQGKLWLVHGGVTDEAGGTDFLSHLYEVDPTLVPTVASGCGGTVLGDSR